MAGAEQILGGRRSGGMVTLQAETRIELVRLSVTLSGMVRLGSVEVLPTTEARARLSQIASDFAHHGLGAQPVVFGSHRKPQGVILPWELWVEVAPAVEDALDAAEARERLVAAGESRVDFAAAAKALGRDPSRYR